MGQSVACNPFFGTPCTENPEFILDTVHCRLRDLFKMEWMLPYIHQMLCSQIIWFTKCTLTKKKLENRNFFRLPVVQRNTKVTIFVKHVFLLSYIHLHLHHFDRL